MLYLRKPEALEVLRPDSLLFLLAFMVCLLGPTPALAQDADTTPPQLVDFSYIPLSIDVSAGPETVTATFHVTDNLPGTSFAHVTFQSPSARQFQFINGLLVAGDRLDGTFQGSLSFPQFSENGTWIVIGVSLIDLAGNSTFLNTAVLQERGFPTALDVFSDPTDVTAPTVTGISISPAAVDVSAGPQTITVALDVTDNLSGAIFTPSATGSFFGFFPVQFRSPSGQQFTSAAFFNAFALVAGIPQNGTWEGNVFFPRFSEDGTWRINFLQVKDVTRNIVSLDTAALEAMGFPTSLIWSLQANHVLNEARCCSLA